MSKEITLKPNLNGVASNRDSAGRFKQGTHWRPHAIFREKQYLLYEYSNNQRSAADIAKEHGVTEGAILFWLGKHKIKTRTMAQTREIKHWGLRGKENPMFGKCGAENPRWIDGRSPLRQRIYARSFWREIIQAVLKRDGHKCLRCGAPHAQSNRLHSHHVKSWTFHPEARFEVSNIISVCEDCHTWIHSRKNTRHEYLSP